MALHLLQEHDLAEGALRVSGILEGVEDFLQRDDVLCPPIGGPPHDAIRALAQLLYDVVLARHVPIDLVRRGHGRILPHTAFALPKSKTL